MMTDRIPYNLQTLSSVLGRPQDEIKYAIELFTEFRLIDVLATGEMYMSDIQNFIGQSSTEGDRKRKYRKQIEEQKEDLKSGKQLPNHRTGQMSHKKGQMSDKRPPEIEKEIEIEIEKKDKPVFEFEGWKKDFSIYKKYVEFGFSEAMSDTDFLNELNTSFQALDVKKTVRVSYNEYSSRS